jgi:hypothetical protein
MSTAGEVIYTKHGGSIVAIQLSRRPSITAYSVAHIGYWTVKKYKSMSEIINEHPIYVPSPLGCSR